MGRRGPAPQPTALKLLKGTRPDRVNRSEPKPAEVPLERPAILDDQAAAVWDRLVVDLRARTGLSAWDADSLAVFCQAVAINERAYELVATTGVLIKGRSRGHAGEVVKHPALTVWKASAEVIHRFAQEFGLTPAARSSLVGNPLPDEGSPWRDPNRLLS